MASAIIHMAVAKRVKEKLNLEINDKEFYLGTIAPDISKEINRSRDETHFAKDKQIDLEYFESKYKKYLNNPFELGYYIHLCTDYLWLDIVKNLMQEIEIKLANGEIVNLEEKEFDKILYNDYTNMNVLLLEEYNMDLSLFYEEFLYPVIHIEEVPNNLLNLIVNKMGIISANSKLDKTYILDIKMIKNFIEESSDFCIEKINNLRKNFQ